jgi:hypothetical protein
MAWRLSALSVQSDQELASLKADQLENSIGKIPQLTSMRAQYFRCLANLKFAERIEQQVDRSAVHTSKRTPLSGN